MIYETFERNHVILPGRQAALEAFLEQDYKGMKHKRRNARSSNSEDALTWSCFDTLANAPNVDRAAALDEIFFDAFEGRSPLSFHSNGTPSADITIHIGKQYQGMSSAEATEVDASVEAPGVLLFFEAKLYSAVSAASPPNKPHDQIARKLRVGLAAAHKAGSAFYFVFLDLAPLDLLFQNRRKAEVLASSGGGYDDKWRSAWLFRYYKHGRNGSLRPLSEALAGVDPLPPVKLVARHMGWLTWADLFKCTLQAALPGIR